MESTTTESRFEIQRVGAWPSLPVHKFLVYEKRDEESKSPFDRFILSAGTRQWACIRRCDFTRQVEHRPGVFLTELDFFKIMDAGNECIRFDILKIAKRIAISVDYDKDRAKTGCAHQLFDIPQHLIHAWCGPAIESFDELQSKIAKLTNQITKYESKLVQATRENDDRTIGKQRGKLANAVMEREQLMRKLNTEAKVAQHTILVHHCHDMDELWRVKINQQAIHVLDSFRFNRSVGDGLESFLTAVTGDYITVKVPRAELQLVIGDLTFANFLWRDATYNTIVAIPTLVDHHTSPLERLQQTFNLVVSLRAQTKEIYDYPELMDPSNETVDINVSLHGGGFIRCVTVVEFERPSSEVVMQI